MRLTVVGGNMGDFNGKIDHVMLPMFLESIGLTGVERIEQQEGLDLIVWGPIGLDCVKHSTALDFNDGACEVLLVVVDENECVIDDDYSARGPYTTYADLREAIREVLVWSIKTALAFADLLENPWHSTDPYAGANRP